MTTEDALLAAVLAAPDDDLPRLVLADHYEGELGQPERAEFIRVQVEIARICGNRKLPIWSEEMAKALEEIEPHRERERHLWENGTNPLREWFGVVGKDVNLFLSHDGIHTSHRPAYVVTRGFVSEVRCTLADWCGDECHQCAGTGRSFPIDGPSIPCRRCGGSLVTGIGPRVVRRHPVEKVTLTDRDPAFGASPTFRWTDASEPNPLYSFRSHPQNQLPHDLFRLVNGNMKVPNQSPYIKWFPTKEYALSALSTALIVWAKSQNVTTKDYSDYHDHLAGGCLHGQPPASSFPT